MLKTSNFAVLPPDVNEDFLIFMPPRPKWLGHPLRETRSYLFRISDFGFVIQHISDL
jgi:hypothetical protein